MTFKELNAGYYQELNRALRVKQSSCPDATVRYRDCQISWAEYFKITRKQARKIRRDYILGNILEMFMYSVLDFFKYIWSRRGKGWYSSLDARPVWTEQCTWERI